MYSDIYMSEYSGQNRLIIDSLKKYYSNHERLEEMLKIISSKSHISLRLVDWFATNYAKEYNTKYIVNGKRFKVYNDYKLNLKAYSKKRFDPFCRWDRIYFPYTDNNHIETTIGQLNFFKWAQENNVINYINEHYDEIEQDMNKRNSTSKRKKMVGNELTKKIRKKREELSKSTRCVYKENADILINFK